MCLTIKVKVWSLSKECAYVSSFPDHLVVMLTMLQYHARVPAWGPRILTSPDVASLRCQPGIRRNVRTFLHFVLSTQ